MRLIEVDNPGFSYEIGLVDAADEDIAQAPEPAPLIMTPVIRSARGAIETARRAVIAAEAARTEAEVTNAGHMLSRALTELSAAGLQNDAAVDLAEQALHRTIAADYIGDIGILAAIRRRAEEALNKIRSGAARVGTAVKSAAGKVATTARNLTTRAAAAVREAAVRAPVAVRQAAVRAAEGVRRTAVRATEGVRRTATTLAQTTGERARQAVTAVGAGLTAATARIRDAFNDMTRRSQRLFSAKEGLKRARARTLAKWRQVEILEPRVKRPATRARIASRRAEIKRLDAETQKQIREAETQIGRARGVAVPKAPAGGARVTGIGEIGALPVAVPVILKIVAAITAVGGVISHLTSQWNAAEQRLIAEIALLHEELAITREELAITQQTVAVTNEAIVAQQGFNEQLITLVEQQQAAVAAGEAKKLETAAKFDDCRARFDDALARGDTATASGLQGELTSLQNQAAVAGSAEFDAANELQRRIQELELRNSGQWNRALDQVQDVPPISPTPIAPTVPATDIPEYAPFTPEAAIMPEVPAEPTPGMGVGIAILAGLLLFAAAGKPKAKPKEKARR